MSVSMGRRFFISAAFLSALAGARAYGAPPAELEIGDSAPDFRLPDENGKMHFLSDYVGRTVVLMFYPKDFTPG